MKKKYFTDEERLKAKRDWNREYAKRNKDVISNKNKEKYTLLKLEYSKNPIKCPNPMDNHNCCGNLTYYGYINKKLCKSCSHYGKIHTDEHKQKTRDSMKGKHVGKDNPMYGKSIKKIMIDKYGEDFWNEHVKKYSGERNGFYGRTHTLETKNKISNANVGKLVGDNNPSKRPEVRKKIRLDKINRLESIHGQLSPNYNTSSISIIEEYGRKHGYNFQHAENGGEYRIPQLGFWVDGYDKDNNVVIEYYEKAHYKLDGTLKSRELNREREIMDFLNCKFIRINAFDNDNLLYEVITK